MVDESQQNQAIAFDSKGYSFFDSNTLLVSDSPNWATKWHHFDTFLPSSQNNIGTRDCYSYRKKIFNRHPYLANALANQYIRIYHEKSLREANLFIGGIDKELILHDLNLSDSFDDLKTFCTEISKKCRLAVVEYGQTEMSYDICRGIAHKYKIDIDKFDADIPFIPTLNKLSCPKWWLKKLNTFRTRHIDQVYRKLNLVNKHKHCYTNDFALENRKTQLKNSFDYLQSNQIINDDGQTFNLLDIYKTSVSNPRIRKAELMTRIRDFEEVADQMGHAGNEEKREAPWTCVNNCTTPYDNRK